MLQKTRNKNINPGVGLPKVSKNDISNIVIDFFFHGILETFEITLDFASYISLWSNAGKRNTRKHLKNIRMPRKRT